MKLFKLIILFLSIPIASFGQCQSGQSLLEIFTNGDYGSWNYQNIVSISSSNGTSVGSFYMGQYDYDVNYCLNPGNYTVQITDSNGNGINCGSYYNHITIELNQTEIFNLDCYSTPSINSNWYSQTHTFATGTIPGCMDTLYLEYNSLLFQ